MAPVNHLSCTKGHTFPSHRANIHIHYCRSELKNDETERNQLWQKTQRNINFVEVIQEEGQNSRRDEEPPEFLSCSMGHWLKRTKEWSHLSKCRKNNPNVKILYP